MKFMANATQTDALREAQDSADRRSLSAHQDTAEATATTDPTKHLEAAKTHAEARDKHAGLASFHKSFGNKGAEQKASDKAAEHGRLAKSHAQKAADLL